MSGAFEGAAQAGAADVVMHGHYIRLLAFFAQKKQLTSKAEQDSNAATESDDASASGKEEDEKCAGLCPVSTSTRPCRSTCRER